MMSESQNVAKTISGWVAGESVCLRISIIKQTYEVNVLSLYL